MKLFPRLALVVSGLMLGSILAISAWVYAHEKRDVEKHAREEQKAILQNLSNMAEESIVADDDLMLVKYIRLLRQWNSSVMSASVVGPQGQILAHTEINRIGKPAEEDVSGPSVGLVLSQGVDLRNHHLGTASVSFSESRLQEAIDAQIALLKRRLAGITCLTLLLGLAFSFWIAHSWARPIKRLAKAFEQIGKGKWDIDLGSLERRKDEIGFLSRSCLTMAEELAQLDQLKDDFVSAVSHELRSPLGTIESYLDRIETVRLRGDPPERWIGYLEPIRTSAARLERFVDDLLDVAVFETGKLQLERQTTHLPEVAQDVLNLFEIKFREKRITSELHFSDFIPKAYVDPGRVRQVFTNLVSNAFKFTAEGGHIEISIEAWDSGKCLRVLVKDTGIGIAQQDQERIFNKFEQVGSARQHVKGAKGSGLGLAMSRALVELHGGGITVKSEPGHGSTFIFTLPVFPVEMSVSLV